LKYLKDMIFQSWWILDNDANSISTQALDYP
jgi:hypothetical protein